MATAAREAHDRLVRRYEEESVDPTFAPAAVKTLRSALSKLGESSSFRTVSVDCKTTLCVADLEWSSYQAVIDEARNLAMYDFDLKCRKFVYHPPPDDPHGAYRASLVLDCNPSRASR